MLMIMFSSLLKGLVLLCIQSEIKSGLWGRHLEVFPAALKDEFLLISRCPCEDDSCQDCLAQR